jgi:hypothetical protein
MGPVPPGTVSPFMPSEFACYAAVHPTPRAAPPAPAPVAPESCGDELLDCPQPEKGVGNICEIDPEACPPPDAGFGVAYWTQVYPNFCTSWEARSPRPLEVGKRDPLSEWTFPFGSNCRVEGSSGVGLRRIRVDASAAASSPPAPAR